MRLLAILSITSILLNSRLVLSSGVVAPDALTETLSVKIIEDAGFGSNQNIYSWTMESFKNQIYVGTFNNKYQRLGVQVMIAGIPNRFFTNGAEIHRGTRNDADGTYKWEKVVTKGLGSTSNFGVRKLIAVGKFIYAATVNHKTGFEIWQSFDGSFWEKVSNGGFGTKKNTSGRGLIVLNNHLYVTTENRKRGGEIWRRKLTSNGNLATNTDWENVVDAGIDSKDNYWFSDFTLHVVGQVEYIYTGTWNRKTGGELWRSIDGENWEAVFRNGNGNSDDWAIMKLYSFKGLLYLGTMNWAKGAALLVSTDNTATEFGYVWKNGRGNEDNAYMWYIIDFNNRLYVSTFNSGKFNEFDLYSSATPEKTESWVVETLDAFGIADKMYGIRSMAIHNDRLIMGGASRNVATKVFEAEFIGIKESDANNETNNSTFSGEPIKNESDANNETNDATFSGEPINNIPAILGSSYTNSLDLF